MKCAALGWYGHQNEGDERIGECLRLFVESKGGTLDLIDPFSKGFHQINSYDFVFYGGGGLIHRGFNKCTYILDQIRRPMGFVGISVEACDDTNNLFIEKMKEKAEFIYVRDKRSAKELEYHHKVIQSEDLSFLYPWDIVEDPYNKNKNTTLNLRSWQYWATPYASAKDKKLRALYRKFPKLYDLMVKFSPSKEVFSPKSIVRSLQKRFGEVEALSFYDEPVPGRKVYPVNGNDQDIFDFTNIKSGPFDLSKIEESKLMIAMRLHCVIYCIQMGIPCLSLNYEPKSKGLLQNLGVEEIGLSVFNAQDDQINEKLDYIENNYDEIREKFLKYREFAHKDVHKTMNRIFDLVQSGGTLSQ